MFMTLWFQGDGVASTCQIYMPSRKKAMKFDLFIQEEKDTPPPLAPDFLLYLNGQDYDTCPPLASRETGKSIILAFLPQR